MNTSEKLIEVEYFSFLDAQNQNKILNQKVIDTRPANQQKQIKRQYRSRLATADSADANAFHMLCGI